MLDVGSTEIRYVAHDFGAIPRKKSVSENHWPLGAIQVYRSSVVERSNTSNHYFSIHGNPSKKKRGVWSSWTLKVIRVETGHQVIGNMFGLYCHRHRKHVHAWRSVINCLADCKGALNWQHFANAKKYAPLCSKAFLTPWAKHSSGPRQNAQLVTWYNSDVSLVIPGALYISVCHFPFPMRLRLFIK